MLLKVLCTIVIIGPYGSRDVKQLDGVVVKEQGSKLYVDFSPAPISPQVQWANENDCTYYDEPEKVYGDFLDLQQQWKAETEANRQKFHKDLLRDASKRRKAK